MEKENDSRVNQGAKEKERENKKTKIYHLSVNILVLAMKIPIWLSVIYQPKRPTNRANSDGTIRMEKERKKKKHTEREENPSFSKRKNVCTHTRPSKFNFANI